MEVEVRLFATFRKGRWKHQSMSFDNQPKIEDILKQLDIQERELGIVLINGRHCDDTKTHLNDRDILSIFPPVGGG